MKVIQNLEHIMNQIIATENEIIELYRIGEVSEEQLDHTLSQLQKAHMETRKTIITLTTKKGA